MLQFDELGRQPWYVGDVSRRSAESMVRSCDYDGAFVVRQSQKGGTDNPFTLTLLYASTVYNLHVRRRRTDDKFSIGKEKPGEVVSLLMSCTRRGINPSPKSIMIIRFIKPLRPWLQRRWRQVSREC